MATETQLDIDISPAPDSGEHPAPDGSGQQATGQPARQSGSRLRAFAAVAALMVLLVGSLAFFIGVFQPFTDQVGGCGGG